MRVVDLFAGCGGLSLGFQNAGFQIVGAVEFWDVAFETYRHNFSHPIYKQDLSDVSTAVDLIRPLLPDMIIGGPPCQDFSHAGKRIEAERAGLTGKFAEIIAKTKPRYFVMENVDRAKDSVAYAYAKQIFKKSGYGITEATLDASHCGVPQRRKRFFVLGILGGNDDFATTWLNTHQTKKEVTIRDYFGSNVLGFDFYYRHPRNYNRRAIYSIDEPAPTMRGVNRPVPKGYPGHPLDPHPVDNTIRALTTLERALIQTFPAGYKWVGSKTDIEQMIGNAVPVKLAEFVATCMAQYIVEVPDYSGFETWLHKTNYSDRVIGDILSRLKRANKILEDDPNPTYLFILERTDSFLNIDASVRSQIKKAVSLYIEYKFAMIAQHYI
nr:DNA cytosine methyltransferase [uncultured Oscillibacter sp.]